MKDRLINFYSQIQDAYEMAKNVELPEISKFENIIICGMGGSAISGDLLFNYLFSELSIPLYVNREYTIPNFVNNNTLAFVSSYSGNTEETLSSYKLLRERTDKIIAITSDGILENEYNKGNIKYIVKIPKGYQPREALGWLFIPLIVILSRLNVISEKEKEINETISLLKNLSEKYKEENDKNLTPYSVAKKLLGKLIIVYSDNRFSGVVRRWATQINENSKMICHFNLFSELNHNEIVGFGNIKLQQCLIFLKSIDFYSRINLRMELTKELYKNVSDTEIIEINACGNSLLSRMFSLIYFGDWVSYYLAILQNVDPVKIERIDWLKEKLEKIK